MFLKQGKHAKAKFIDEYACKISYLRTEWIAGHRLFFVFTRWKFFVSRVGTMLKKMRSLILAVLVTGFYWMYSRFWRIEHVRKPQLAAQRDPILWAHWHGDELFLIGAHVGSGMAVMVSRSQDGEMLKRVLSWFGYRVVRGSSSRGGAGGLKGLIDVVQKERRDASLAVDGPRGPLFKVKPGIIKLAQETGFPIVSGVSAAKSRYVFQKAWNRCYLPLPFSKCVLVYGEPLFVPRNLTESEFEKLRLRLENELLAGKREAEEYFGRGAHLGAPKLEMS